MSKEQKALERIKDEVAKENGYFDYDQMVEIRKPTKDTYDGIFDIICERYARECYQATESAIGNLLAVMHGDGGQYRAKHGTVKAIEDAQELLYKKWKSIQQVQDSCQATLEKAAENASLITWEAQLRIDKFSITNKDNICIL